MSEHSAPSRRNKRERGEYSPIARVLIDGPDFQQLSPIARHVFLTLKVMFGPSGIEVQYPNALLATLTHTTGWTSDNIANALDELDGAWIEREAHVLWIVKHLRFHPNMKATNENHRWGVQSHVSGLPRLAIVRRFIEHYIAFFADVTEPAAGFPEDGRDIAMPMATEGHDIAMPMATESLRDHAVPKPIRIPKTQDPSPTGERAAEAAESNGAEKINSAKRHDEPAKFTEAMRIYPRRAGANPRGDALRSWRARVADGVSEAVMIQGTQRYREFLEATGKLGTEYVQQAARFFGKSRGFDESWDLPAAAADHSTARRPNNHRPQQFEYSPTEGEVKWAK